MKIAHFITTVSLVTMFGCSTQGQGADALSLEARASGNTSALVSSEVTENSPYRGWDYVAQKLIEDGIPSAKVQAVFGDSQMPEFTPVPFKLRPKESSQMYSEFTAEKHVQAGLSCLKENLAAFTKAEHRFHISRYVITSILLIETHCGKNTGNQLVLNRLARVSSVGSSSNIDYNLKVLQAEDPAVTRAEVIARAQYLEQTFYPELLTLFELTQNGTIDILSLRGSMAGAFGIPQFLPSSFRRYAVDGDQDGEISLFSQADAIFSAAHFLSSYGWRDNAPMAEKLKVLWAYNRSEAYGQAILKVAIQMKQRTLPRQKKPTLASVGDASLAKNG